MISDRERKKSSQYLSSKNGLGPRKNILQEHEGVRFLEQEAYHGAPKDSVIKSCEGTKLGSPESPALFSDSIQDLIDSLESKINLWYLDDGNLSDDYRTVLKDLKRIVEAEKTLGLKIKHTN